jgi:hypothetical protein
MRWWLLSIFFICPLVSLFTSGSSPTGQSSSSEWLEQLHFADCELPCFIHIVPGLTTLAEAQAQVQTVYADASLYDVSKGEYSYRIIYRPTGHEVRIVLRSDDGPVTPYSVVRTIFLIPLISAKPPITYPTISELQSVLGDPTAVRLGTGVEIESIVLFYREGRVTVWVNDTDCDQVLPSQQIISIGLHNETPPSGGWLSLPQEWVGYNHCYNFERQLS